jgi:hypothetical protein
MKARFTACVLLYGDHPDLARRVLTPLLPLREAGRIALRVGANAVGQETARFLIDNGLIVEGSADDRDTCWDPHNGGKYPMMRRMLYRGPHAVATDYVMWFDDDSFFRPEAPADLVEYLAGVMDQGYDLLGIRYHQTFLPGQADWVKAQPWYAGVPFYTDMRGRACSRFAQGGWWCARAATLARWDYPWPALHHNGGDVMLGELAHQQGWRVEWQRPPVAANADAAGRESEAPRRGLRTTPIGATSP